MAPGDGLTLPEWQERMSYAEPVFKEVRRALLETILTLETVEATPQTQPALTRAIRDLTDLERGLR